MTDPRRLVPRTDVLLADPRLVEVAGRLGHARVKAAVLAVQQLIRDGDLPPDQAVPAVLAGLPEAASSLTPVLNATGVVLHTNLGRARLSPPAVDAMQRAAGYLDVEFDLGTGRRARRGRGTLAALEELVPARALVVNNGAAALLLAITALAAGREVVISRGELVEIGDGFRLPELIETTGARIREVGTTNRTGLADYAAAVGPQTGCVLKVHPSNFRIEGFTSGASIAELATLGVPVVADIGSGLLHPDALLPDEPDVTSSLEAGAGLVTCSGDKLLGGPQAGLVFGTAELVERLRRHPLARALRVDKLTLAALEASIAGPATPTARYLHADPDQLRRRCERVAAALRAETGAEVVPSAGAVGGGGAPGLELPGWAVALPEAFAAALRTGRPAVIGRLERGRCLLDLRCVEEAEDAALTDAVRAAARALTDGQPDDADDGTRPATGAAG
ncbi:L-seryl-tRNA(Sec) selenium transferase [Jatrophihabitans sp.]|uniref:L-seryl-tRNA(Sec) selenium transferase n=1 Tax=Jatrophihabitans sp. TaxID=1932789 RepID=UPI002BF4ED5D|nr:L-seryl-tRNA(Sec) selenium transferase [Jatrophihabitans sp.]